MTNRSRLPSGYTIFTSVALVAAAALTACGPDDGVASGAVQAAGTPVAAVQPAAAVPASPVAPPGVAPATQVATAQPLPAGALSAVPPGYVLVPASSLAQPAGNAAPQPAVAQPATRAMTTAQAEPAPRARHVASATAGRVRSVEPIRTRPEGSGVGGVVGGVLGAVVGNQFGGGNGRIATTALGAVGGAVAGNNVERNHKAGITGYRVRVEFDNGDSRTYEESAAEEFRVGDRVNVRNGQLRRV